MPPPTRNQVFISYSHEDTKWRKDLEIQLKPYRRVGSIISWSDEQITPGSEWLTEIKTALTNTKVAVLLITPDFIASDFIDQYELGPFLKEAKQGGVRILWVSVRTSSYKKTELNDYQAVLDPEKPLADMMDADRDKAWVRICEEIEKAVGTPVAPLKKQNYLAETFAALRALDSERRNNHLAVVAIATDFLAAILQSLHGLTFTEPATKMRICLMSIAPAFSLGYPKINAAFEGQWNNRAIHFEAEGVLKHELGHAGGRLRIIILHVASIEVLPHLDLVNVLNNFLPTLSIPLPDCFELAFKGMPIEDILMPFPKGSVKLHLTLPSAPPLSVRWRAVTAFFDELGMRLISRISTTDLPPITDWGPVSDNVAAPTVDELQEAFAKWAAPLSGQSLYVRMPSKVFLGFATPLNRLPEAQRTVDISLKDIVGHLFELDIVPIQVKLDAPESAKIFVKLRDFESRWSVAEGEKPPGINATFNVEAAGLVNAKVAFPFFFDVGFVANIITSSDITVALVYKDAEKAFTVQIERPANVVVTGRLEKLFGIPDQVANLIGGRWDVSLPVGTGIYRFELPRLIEERLELPMAAGDWPVWTIMIAADPPTLAFKPDALEVFWKVRILNSGSGC